MKSVYQTGSKKGNDPMSISTPPSEFFEEYQYNNFNQLTKVGGASGTVEYAYNADGLRVSKKAGGNIRLNISYKYYETNLLMEVIDNRPGGQTTEYTYYNNSGMLNTEETGNLSSAYVYNKANLHIHYISSVRLQNGATIIKADMCWVL